MNAPPPNPMIARPVAMPGRSGIPLYQRGNRSDVTQTETAATYRAVTQVYQPELVQVDPKRADGEPPAEA